MDYAVRVVHAREGAKRLYIDDKCCGGVSRVVVFLVDGVFRVFVVAAGIPCDDGDDCLAGTF
ncbi:hypothetical protein [uncultured Butyricimonas sp.]|uniref:hypothetical protein n=1 Tax=uncultured Butyricimonas sp. TaxID=1268785 RepID=UPI0026DAFDF9|nr:hypothetical protein [uncultured Butyricimonas sp.]